MLLVAWEDKKALLRMVTPLIRTTSSGLTNILKEDIEEGIIPKEAVTPINKEDPKPTKNPLTPTQMMKKWPTKATNQRTTMEQGPSTENGSTNATCTSLPT